MENDMMAEIERLSRIESLAIDFVQKVSRWCEQQPETISFSAAMTFGREALDLAEALEVTTNI